MTDALAALVRYLHERVFPEWRDLVITGVDRSGGGLSWETFVLDVAEYDGNDARRRRLVVKQAPLTGPLAPYDISREAVLLEAFAADGRVPVPPLLAYETEPGVLDRPFSVMGFVEGEIPGLRAIERWQHWQDPAARTEVGRELVATLARIQSVEWRKPAVSRVLDGDRAPAEHVRAHVDRLMDRIDHFVAPAWTAQPVLRDAWLWLHERLTPIASSDAVIVHGDFRVGNLIWHGRQVVAVLDWERADLGDPMVDLGFFCMPMARQRRPELMGMLLPFDELAAHYEVTSGRAVDLERLHYYLVYWQFVELAQVVRALAFSITDAPPGELRHVTSYPLLAGGARQLVSLIERYEVGEHEVV